MFMTAKLSAARPVGGLSRLNVDSDPRAGSLPS